MSVKIFNEYFVSYDQVLLPRWRKTKKKKKKKKNIVFYFFFFKISIARFVFYMVFKRDLYIFSRYIFEEINIFLFYFILFGVRIIKKRSEF